MDIIKSTIKSTLQSAQKELSWKPFRSRDKTANELKGLGHINVDAGADVLHKNRCNWEQIHAENEANAKRALIVDSLTSSIFTVYEQKAVALASVHMGLKLLPEIVAKLEEVTSNIAILGCTIEETEQLLSKLEDVNEQKEHERNKESHLQQLLKYTDARRADLDRLKVQLARDHAKRIADYETNKKVQMYERQQTFQDAFQHDMQHYKVHGHPERTSSVDSQEGSSLNEETLASIAPEDTDSEKLELFLGPDIPETEKNPESTEVQGTEDSPAEDFVPDGSL